MAFVVEDKRTLSWSGRFHTDTTKLTSASSQPRWLCFALQFSVILRHETSYKPIYIYFHLCFKIRRKIQADLRNFIINNEQLVSEIFSYKERNQISYSNVVSFIKTSMACEMNKDAAPLPTTDVMHLLKCVICVARSEAGQSGLS